MCVGEREREREREMQTDTHTNLFCQRLGMIQIIMRKFAVSNLDLNVLSTTQSHLRRIELCHKQKQFFSSFFAEARNGPSISLSAGLLILCPVVYQQHHFLNDFFFFSPIYVAFLFFCMCVDLLANFTKKSQSF